MGIGGAAAAKRGDLVGQIVEPACNLATVGAVGAHGARGGQCRVQALGALGLTDGEHRPPAGPWVVVGCTRQHATGLSRKVEREHRGGEVWPRGAVAHGHRGGEQGHLSPAGGIAALRSGARCSCEGVGHAGHGSAAPARGRHQRWQMYDHMVTRMGPMATTEQTHVPVHEAKAKFSEMIRRVGEGEEIVITSHGMPVAKLVPPEPQKLSGEAAVAAILETRRAIAIRITPEEIREWIDDGRM